MENIKSPDWWAWKPLKIIQTISGASGNNFRRTDPLFRYLNDNLPADINNVGSSSIATEWSFLSFFSQLSYAYDSRYVLSASVRRDGSSRFGPNNRWGTFPPFQLPGISPTSLF
ncbi:MAG: TonB-dependent receptor [Saprospiraceae bacterium]|nr:TonB-dependent receptor [Saprospiraceae bacterium]